MADNQDKKYALENDHGVDNSESDASEDEEGEQEQEEISDNENITSKKGKILSENELLNVLKNQARTIKQQQSQVAKQINNVELFENQNPGPKIADPKLAALMQLK